MVIQAQWRGVVARRRYQRLQWAVGVVGERYRAVWRGREVRRELERVKWAVGVIEERYLALKEGRKHHKVGNNPIVLTFYAVSCNNIYKVFTLS